MKNKLMDMIRYFGGRLSFRNIGAMLAMSKTTVSTYFKKWEEKGLPKGKSSLDECTPSELYVHLNGKERESGKIVPDFSNVERRLAEHGTTRARLWAEYRDGLEDPAKGLGYAQYTRRLAKEATARGLVLRRTHEPGYVAFVDYSGKRPSYCDKATGEAVPVELFVGVLGASGYTFACCTASQAVPDWLDAHTQMLAFFGGAPATVSPDNLKSAIADAGKDPTVQEHYLAWGRKNTTAIVPARPGRPRDKGLVENAVLNVQRWVLPELRKRKFYSLEALNEVMAKLMEGYNARPFQKREGSRRSEFERLDRAALQPLPREPYVYGKWVAKQTVPADYHLPVYGHYYSVPHAYVGWKAEAKVVPAGVEIYVDGQCVAKHARGVRKGGTTTDVAHQPDAHRAQGERSPKHLLDWARKIGPSMLAVVEHQFAGKVRLQGLPAAWALRDLERGSNPAELEAAASRAVKRKLLNYTAVKRCLSEPMADPFLEDDRTSGALRHRPRRRKKTASAAVAPASSRVNPPLRGTGSKGLRKGPGRSA
ncbi:transposase [Tahibacter aquaticus]|uniref:Transposase n=1 Tax=Tahibacter aquaticus TaxID=520092 RepID=A0A4R6Z4K7_9GAMM|nr:IS21 family transposase [Tahibacter aquaticus]TDR46544.1 transposase [Tahibacter aquaticus]